MGKPVKVWLSLPDDFKTSPPWNAGVSIGSMSPPLTEEMRQDGLKWYEAEVIREAPSSRIPLPRWGY